MLNPQKVLGFDLKRLLRKDVFFLFSLFFFCNLHNGLAQHFNARLLTLQDGLSSQYVWDIDQDDEGIMWILTMSGLDLYDGYHWTHFDSLPGIPSFPKQRYSEIHKGQDGTMWLLGADYLDRLVAVRYDQQSKKWTHSVVPLMSKTQIILSDVQIIDGQYHILIANSRQIALSTDGGESWSVEYIQLESGDILNVHFYENEPYAFCENGVFKKFGKDWNQQKFPFENSPRYEEIKPILSMEKHPEGGTILLGKNSLFIFDGNKLIEEKVLESAFSNVYGHNQIDFLPNGKIIASINSKVHVEYPGNRYEIVKANLTHNDSIINRFFVDRQGIIWVSTTRGILVFTNLGFYSYDQQSGLLENEVSSTAFFDDGTVLLGTNTGWQIFRDQKFIYSEYLEESSYKSVRLQQTAKDGDAIVVAATNLGLIRIYKDGRSKQLYVGNTHSVVNHKGSLYFLNDQYSVLWKLDENDRAIAVNDSFNFPKMMYVRKLISSEDQIIYALGSNGIYDLSNGRMIYSTVLQNLIDREMNVFDFAKLPDNSFLIGTMSGLMKFNPDTGELIRQYMQFDFPIYTLLKNDSNQLYIGSDRGLFVLNLETEQIQNYSTYDGLISNEINRDALEIDNSGRIWIGTSMGLSILHEEMFNQSVKAPIISFTNVKDLSTENLFDISKVETIKVKSNTTLSAQLIVAGFYAPDLLEIRYRLMKGSDWIYEKGNFNRTKIFHALSAGTYQIEVQAREANLPWSETKFFPLIIVERPFYLQLWFFFVVATVLAGIAILLYRNFTLSKLERKLQTELDKRTESLRDSQFKLEEQNRELTEVNKSLDQFTSAVSHDLKSPLNSSIGLLDLVDESFSKDELLHFFGMINTNLKKMKAFIHELIEISRNANQGLKYERIELKELIREIYDLHDQTPEEKRIEKSLTINEKTEFLGDKNRLKVIFSNLISNAIKYHHSDATNPYCEVQIDVFETEANIVVRDNGMGISKKHLGQIFEMFYRANSSVGGSGLGLFLVHEIIKKMDGSIHATSEEGRGSSFYLRIPNGNSKMQVNMSTQTSQQNPFSKGDRMPSISSEKFTSKK